MSMIERAAMAVQKRMSVYGPDYEGIARAVIEAMREPTDEMWHAGHNPGWERGQKFAQKALDEHRRRNPKSRAVSVSHDFLHVQWDAMIDAALKD